MGNWINKHLKKSKCVKVILVDEGRKQSEHYLIPKNSLVKIDTMQFQIDNENYMIDHKRYITYIFNTRNIESVNLAVDPITYMKNTEPYNPISLNTVIDNEVATQILKHSKTGIDNSMMIILMIALMMVGFFVLYYTLGNQIAELREIITGGNS